MRRLPLRPWLAPLAAFAIAPPACAERLPADREAFFESRVRPLLVERCEVCHGDAVAEAGLRLDSRPHLLAGSESGPVVVPGDADKSRLVAAVRRAGDLAMPPDGPLSTEEIAVLETWVSDGLPWSGPGGDDAGPPPDRAADMQRRLTESLASHWAFRAPQRHPAPPLPPGLPADLAAAWSESAIDRFIAARGDAAGLAPSPEAAPRALIRRLWLDLTGLPPPAAEVDAFCADPSDDRYRDLVDRLLASRAHAEHWARKWLDLARYADTMGYVLDGQEARYPFAWTYRDWVVSALAADLPYDRFVTLQLAADLVTPPVPPADLAALGFLTVGRTFLGNTHDIIDDRIDLVTRGLMGLTVACARCHDHKYEPVTTADYYALHGIFASCSVPEQLPAIGPPPAGPEAQTFAAKRRALEEEITRHEASVHARITRDAFAHAAAYFLETARPTPRGNDDRPPRLADGYDMQQLMIDRMHRLLGGATAGHPILGLWASVRRLSDAEIPATVAAVLDSWEAAGGEPAVVNPLVREEMASARPRTLRDVAEAYQRLMLRVAPEFAGDPAATAAGGSAAVAASPPAVVALRQAFAVPGTPLVVPAADLLRVADSADKLALRRLDRALTRHDIESPGGPTRAMVLRDLECPVDSPVLIRGNPARPGPIVERRLPAVLGGTPTSRHASGRLDLARAVVAADNPLSPRMLVNWAWTHHFGRGLVATPDDLGLRGEPPSHPQLLDDLARRFIDEGRQSLRWLHREIVTSRAWRQASDITPEAAAADPDNVLFLRANRRRLEWEAWRDSLLVAAGTLDPAHRGGPGIDPLVPEGMHARSLFARLDRQHVPGMLRVFDIANPDTAVHVRAVTTVPQQQLAVLNAPLVVAAARRAADHVTATVGPDAAPYEFVTGIWRAVLARDPEDDERASALVWLAAEEAADSGTAAMPARARLAHALMATAEFQHVD